jgi:hypothetical protein
MFGLILIVHAGITIWYTVPDYFILVQINMTCLTLSMMLKSRAHVLALTLYKEVLQEVHVVNGML